MRGSLWPIPLLGVVVAIALGVGLPAVDEVLEDGGGASPLTFVFGGGPSAARDLLAAIAGSLISVTGLVFSLTVVALQLGSSQYSPRLLATFVTDRVVQLTLAQLVLTFVYALTVLRTVRTQDASESDYAFVPRLSITVAYLLTLGAVVALVLFLGHLARSLRVETMLRDVHDEAVDTYDDVLGTDPPGPRSAVRLPDGPATPLAATSSGFLVEVDEQALAAAARGCDALVVLDLRIGDSVVAGTPLAHAWAPPGTDLDPLRRALGTAVELDFERATRSDVAYSLRKVVDIAARALSSGINDPTTAVHALSHVSALLGDLVHRRLEPVEAHDEDGVLRVVVPQWDLPALLHVALEEPLEYAGGSPAVLRRLAGLLRELAWRAPEGTVDDAVREGVERVCRVAAETTSVPTEETAVWRRSVEDALAGTWAPRLHPHGTETG